MRIQNNITAMNTHRQYTINNDNVAKSAEKLSSGYRINRAGDDAAGLAISEKMRSQIRGLNMATKNSQDAISLVQTAEGALQETHSMLQRMNELAVQAATGTNQESDRMALAKEFEQLKKEINDVAEQTTFNNMKILDGSLSYKGYERSAATAGVTVTRPTQLEGATSAGSSGPKVLGATVSASDTNLTTALGATTNVATGQTVTLKAEYTDADGNQQTVTFTAKNTTAGDVDLKDLLAGDTANTPPTYTGLTADKEGWSAEVGADGTIKLTSTVDPNMAENTQVKLTMDTSDDNLKQANALFENPIEMSGTVALAKVGDPVAATNDTITIDASGATFGSQTGNKTMNISMDVNGEDLTVTIAKAAGNGQSISAAGVSDADISLTGTAASKWDAKVDGDKIILTAKDATTGTAPTVENVAVAGGANNHVTAGASATATAEVGKAASTKEDPAAQATKPTITGASVGQDNADLQSAAANDTFTITADLGDGKTIKFTGTAQAAGLAASAIFANGVTSDDGNWKVTMAADGALTFESLADPGKTNFGSEAKIGFETSANGVTTLPAMITNGQIENGTEGTKTSTSGSGVTTVEYDFAKLQNGDTVEVDIDGKTVTVTKEAGDTRDSFIKKLENAVQGIAGVKVSGTAIVAEDGVEVGEPKLAVDSLADAKTNAIRIQVGALENEQLNIAIDSMNTKGLGLDGFSLEDQDKAGAAITAVRNAVLKVADQRATLGAMQNRLDHKIANLKVTSENLSAAESRIRDVDMASEMTNFTKNNILSQAATAMLAQANALPQNVLSLLG